jgi:hypothetical protein
MNRRTFEIARAFRGFLVHNFWCDFALMFLRADHPQSRIVDDLNSRQRRKAEEKSKKTATVTDKVESRQLLLKNEGKKVRILEEDLEDALV